MLYDYSILHYFIIKYKKFLSRQNILLSYTKIILNIDFTISYDKIFVQQAFFNLLNKEYPILSINRYCYRIVELFYKQKRLLAIN